MAVEDEGFLKEMLSERRDKEWPIGQADTASGR
jgi:hypothetical protein